MKNAIYYVLLFIAIQFFTYYPTIIIWLMAEGMPASRAVSLTLQGNVLISTPMVIVTQLLFSLLMIAIFLWRKYCKVSPAWLRTRQWQVLIWSCIAGLGTIIPSQALQEMLPDLPDALQQTMAGLMSSRWGYIVVCILAPLTEEIVFRGAILKSLLKSIQPVWAIAISALLFALIHANMAQMPHAFIIGLLLGWMYYRTGSILPGIAMHWINNTVAYATFRIAPNLTDSKLIEIFGTTPRVWMAIGFSLLILLPALLQLHLNMKKAN